MPKGQVRKVVNGTLRLPVLEDPSKADFEVTALTSSLSKTAEKRQDHLTVAQAEYTFASTFTPSLRGFDALVILLNCQSDVDQIEPIDAAVESDVPNVIPSCFGTDTSIPELCRLPAVAPKARRAEHLDKRAEEEHFVFTRIQTGIFFERAPKVGLFTDPRSAITVFDGVFEKASRSNLDAVRRAVETALRKMLVLRCKFLLMQSFVLSQK